MYLECRSVNAKGEKGFQLTDIDFSVEEGFITGIVGKNGAGKSTLFHLFMSRKKEYQGEIRLDGKEIHENHTEFLDEVGYIVEENTFITSYSARENARYLGAFYTNFDTALFEALMHRQKLSLSKTIGSMSRGELMKFQVAFAVAHHPKLYLIDEATAGMDPVFRVEFYRILHEILEKERCAILISTHIEEEIERQIDYVGVLEEGKLISFKENFPE